MANRVLSNVALLSLELCFAPMDYYWLVCTSFFFLFKVLFSDNQARSQDRFWGGFIAGPPKCGPFGPKKWTFFNLTPLPSYKNPIFGPLCG